MKSFRKDVKGLTSHFYDKARRPLTYATGAMIPHKVKLDGKTITKENFDPRIDISKLNLNELHFLDVFREEKWDFDKACEKLGYDKLSALATYKRCLWFKQEDAYVRAKAKVPTPEYILAKDVDNLEGAKEITDSQHKSLDRLAKITGSFKTNDITITQNFLQMPSLTPDQEQKLRLMADAIATEEVKVA